jgi:PGF-CTERM protein
MVALVLFVLIAILPASAISASQQTGLFNGSVILGGAPTPQVFIGEDYLNLTGVLTANTFIEIAGSVPQNFKIGWWAPGTFSYPNNPSQIVDTQSSRNTFAISPVVFGSYPGTWYCLSANSTTAIGPAFIVMDPSQTVQVWDTMANLGLGQDMTGKSVVRGTALTIREDTNLAGFTVGGRSNVRMRGQEGWLNGTDVSRASVGGGVWWQAAQFGTNGGFTNATIIAPTAPAAGANLLTYVNWSNWSGNVMGASNFSRTYTFNNTIWDGLEAPTRAQNLTAAGGLLWNSRVPDNAVQDWLGQAATFNAVPAAAVDGFISFRVKDESGQTYTRLLRPTTPQISFALTNAWIAIQPWFAGQPDPAAFTGNNGLSPATTLVWDTGALDPGLGTPAYPAGTYTVWSETSLSNIRANYKLAGADYTGKTISASGTVTLVSDTVKIEANKETVVRSKPFSVTVTGRPLTTYQIWVKGTSSMRGGYDDQPPMVGLFQDKVYNDTLNGAPFLIGRYAYENGAGRTIRMDVCTDTAIDASIYNSSRYYALINTTSSGTRTIEFVTTNMTKAQTYTIRVERQNTATEFKSDEVDVKVEKGAVTITAAGDQSYYLGEEIKFSGTNTETQETFLFLTGPNLNTQGSRFVNVNLDPRRTRLDAFNTAVGDGIRADFMIRPVNADNTWDWKWGTANWALDAGTYTVYAVSGPHDANHLGNVAYGTVSIIIKKPFISATASQSTLAQGDKLFITGTAEGKPQTGIAIWILGKNYANRVTQSVNSDASFSYELTAATTQFLDAGQYFVVAQHPMQNQIFDIALCAGATPTNVNVCNLQQGNVAGVTQQIFTLTGQGSLQGTDAAEALVQGINSPNVDDTYTKLVFLVEVPVIRIDPIGDRHVGDKFTITATTNLAVDDDVLFEVYSSSFKPTQKTQSGEFSGATGTVKATKGDTGLNKLSFDVDASTFKPDEYIVTANRILQPAATATALFNVLEGTVQTAAPTVATAAPTQAATTAAPTQPPTAAPTKTPTQPGFGALVALIGLGAVAFLVVRKH